MTNAEYVKRVLHLKAFLHKDKMRLKVLLAHWVDAHCPYEFGQVLVLKEDAGSLCGCKGKITERTVRQYQNDTFRWLIVLDLIDVDGRPTTMKHHFTEEIES